MRYHDKQNLLYSLFKTIATVVAKFNEEELIVNQCSHLHKNVHESRTGEKKAHTKITLRTCQHVEKI